MITRKIVNLVGFIFLPIQLQAQAPFQPPTNFNSPIILHPNITCYVCLGDQTSTNDDDCWNSRSCYTNKDIPDNPNMEKCQVTCPIEYQHCGLTSLRNDTRLLSVSRFCSHDIKVDEDPDREGYKKELCYKFKSKDMANNDDDDDPKNKKMKVCDQTCDFDLCNLAGWVEFSAWCLVVNFLVGFL